MRKTIVFLLLVSGFCFQSFSSGNVLEEDSWPNALSVQTGMHSLGDDHAPDFLMSLENKGFFLWRWLFGSSKKGGESRVSPSDNVIRAPLAKPARRGSDSQSPAEWGQGKGRASSNSESPLGLGRSRGASSSSRSPLNLGGSRKKNTSNSRSPLNLGGSRKGASSESKSPLSLGGGSGSSRSNSSSPLNLSKKSSGPASNSKNPTALSRSNRRTRSGSTSFRNEPRPPVGPSYRDRYYGQSKREVGFNIGTAHAFTDLTGTKNVPLAEAMNYQVQHPDITLGAFARFRIVEWFGLSVALDYARITGKDQTGQFDEFRDFSFVNRVIELGGKVEFFAPMKFGSPFDVYGFTGLSIMYNDPILYTPEGNEYTPIQSMNLFQPAIPLGLGFNVRITPAVKLGYELGYRHLVYNFLDGVFIPETGYDSYLYNQLKLSFNLRLRHH